MGMKSAPASDPSESLTGQAATSTTAGAAMEKGLLPAGQGAVHVSACAEVMSVKVGANAGTAGGAMVQRWLTASSSQSLSSAVHAAACMEDTPFPGSQEARLAVLYSG